MKRRTYKLTGTAKADVVAFREAVRTMTSEQLYAESRRISTLKNEARDHLNRTCAMVDIVRDAILAKRSSDDDFGVSEHAVLRYLERVKGLDVRAIKVEIRNYARQFERKDDLDQVVTTPHDLKIALSNSGVVTTIWAERSGEPAAIADVP